MLFRRKMMLSGFGLVALIAVAIVVAIPLYNSYAKEHSVVATVCSKESVALGGTSGGHEYRVYTTSGTFVVKDHVVDGLRTMSADTYGRLQANTTYNISFYGWRIGLTSTFPNILTAKRLPDSQQQPQACNS